VRLSALFAALTAGRRGSQKGRKLHFYRQTATNFRRGRLWVVMQNLNFAPCIIRPKCGFSAPNLYFGKKIFPQEEHDPTD